MAIVPQHQPPQAHIDIAAMQTDLDPWLHDPDPQIKIRAMLRAIKVLDLHFTKSDDILALAEAAYRARDESRMADLLLHVVRCVEATR